MIKDVEKLECAWCGSDSELYRTKFLTIDRIICRNCMNKQDAELADPISDLIDVFNGDSDASKRFWSNLLAGSSIPYSKQFETTVTGGKGASLAVAPSYVIGVGDSFIDLVQDPLDPQTQVDFSRKILPFNLPVAYEALEFIRNQYAGEE